MMDSSGPCSQPVSTPIGSPLRQLSSDQINQQRIPHSPSLPNFSCENDRTNHHRSRESISSDVRSKVEFFNNSIPSSPTKTARPFVLPQTPTHGALQRAVLGFEESQASLASAKAENERLVEQLKAAKHREILVSERIESLIDQLSTERESRNNDKKHYVAEVKKCRKQAYQAELNQLETQENLKEAKQELRRAQAEVVAERAKKEEARQEAFERAYAVSGLTEELEMLKSTIKAVEKERDAAKLELKTTPVGNLTFAVTDEKSIQTSSELLMMASQQRDTEGFTQKHSDSEQDGLPILHDRENSKHGQDVSCANEPFYCEFVARDQVLRDLHDEPFTYDDHIRALYEEVQSTREELARQLDQIEFMHLECQSGSCACRRAQMRGEAYINDHAFANFCVERAKKKRKLGPGHQAQLLPTAPSRFERAQIPVEAQEVEEAIQIPLPSPVEQEFTSKDPSPEPTAVLEELTQVIVEPGKASAPFSFSMSTSTHPQGHPNAAPVTHCQETDVSVDLDMFDMSQATNHPPRPSTAMGILTISSPDRSPIRLVPDSPDGRSWCPKSVGPGEERRNCTSQTVRVALKGSPQRVHPRSQSRPNIRSHARARSPLHKSEVSHSFEKATSASPAASTVFPVTPVVKHHRTDAQQTVTTTTTIPLRDTQDEHLSYIAHFTPASLNHSHAHAHTQPIHLTDDRSTHSQMLSGITGTPVSRDAALAQIRARRDRARSLNMKKMETGGAGGAKTPGSARRGITLRDGVIGGGGDGLSRENREVSITSVQTAPGRF